MVESFEYSDEGKAAFPSKERVAEMVKDFTPLLFANASLGGKGSDIAFHPGKGSAAREGVAAGRDGALIFNDADNKEFLRLESGGKAFVQGELVADNKGVYDAFVEWLKVDCGFVNL